MKKLALSLFVLFAAASSAEAAPPCIGWVLSGDFSGCGTVASPIELSTNVTMPGIASIAGAPGTTSLTVLSTTADGILSARTPVNDTADGKSAIYGIVNGSFNTTTIEKYAYGVRGESLSTRASGANVLNNWGAWGRAAGGQKNIGVLGWVTANAANVEDAGVLGLSDSGAPTAYGLRGNARGSATINYGVFGTATNGGTNYAGYFDGRTYVNSAANFAGLTVANTNSAQTSSIAIGAIDASSATWNVGSANKVATGLDVNMRTACITNCTPNGMTAIGINVRADASGYALNGRTAIYATTTSGSGPPATGNYALYTDQGDVLLNGAVTTNNGITTTGLTATSIASIDSLTVDADGSVGAGAVTVGASKLTVNSSNGNTAVAGTLTADTGNRVFDVAGAGLTSTANTVDVVCLTGLTCAANDISITSRDFGDLTTSSSGSVWTIDNDVVTYAKMQNVSATSRFLGRITAGAGDPEELTGTQATTLLDSYSGSTKGLVPVGAGSTTKYLREDGTWSTVAAGITNSASANYHALSNGTNLVNSNVKDDGTNLTINTTAGGSTAKVTIVEASGNATFAGTMDVTGDFKVNTNKLTVTASSGDTVAAGSVSTTKWIETSAASLSSCGTSPTLTTGSGTHGGKFTTGTGATGCTVTFGTAFANTPFCTVIGAASGQVFSCTVTSSSINCAGALVASTAYGYLCGGGN